MSFIKNKIVLSLKMVPVCFEIIRAIFFLLISKRVYRFSNLLYINETM